MNENPDGIAEVIHDSRSYFGEDRSLVRQPLVLMHASVSIALMTANPITPGLNVNWPRVCKNWAARSTYQYENTTDYYINRSDRVDAYSLCRWLDVVSWGHWDCLAFCIVQSAEKQCSNTSCDWKESCYERESSFQPICRQNQIPITAP